MLDMHIRITIFIRIIESCGTLNIGMSNYFIDIHAAESIDSMKLPGIEAKWRKPYEFCSYVSHNRHAIEIFPKTCKMYICFLKMLGMNLCSKEKATNSRNNFPHVFNITNKLVLDKRIHWKSYRAKSIAKTFFKTKNPLCIVSWAKFTFCWAQIHDMLLKNTISM